MTDLAQQPETGTGSVGLDLGRRLVAEGLGTGFLVIAVIGSGIMASRLSPNNSGLQLLENAAATAAALIGLILIFGAISGALRPVVTLRVVPTATPRPATPGLRRRPGRRLPRPAPRRLMFELPAISNSIGLVDTGDAGVVVDRMVCRTTVCYSYPWPRATERPSRRRVRTCCRPVDRRTRLFYLVTASFGQDRRHRGPPIDDPRDRLGMRHAMFVVNRTSAVSLC